MQVEQFRAIARLKKYYYGLQKTANVQPKFRTHKANQAYILCRTNIGDTVL